MKAINYFKTFVFLIASFALSAALSAQEVKPTDGQPREAQRPANQPQDIRVNALRQLGLSPEQAQQIRKLNVGRKPLMDDAQRRLRQANRALDESIYADQVAETDIQSRLKEFQLAQSEVAKIRFMNELAVRKILTPVQLTRFRELRQRFEQVRENVENRNPANRQIPNNNVRPIRGGQQPIQPLVRRDQKKPNF